jgi:transposase
MRCDARIDLHATNSVVVVLDEKDRRLDQKRFRNELGLILTALEPYRARVQDIAVESTYT